MSNLTKEAALEAMLFHNVLQKQCIGSSGFRAVCVVSVSLSGKIIKTGWHFQFVAVQIDQGNINCTAPTMRPVSGIGRRNICRIRTSLPQTCLPGYGPVCIPNTQSQILLLKFFSNQRQFLNGAISQVRVREIIYCLLRKVIHSCVCQRHIYFWDIVNDADEVISLWRIRLQIRLRFFRNLLFPVFSGEELIEFGIVKRAVIIKDALTEPRAAGICCHG